MGEPTDIGSPVKEFVKSFLTEVEDGLNEKGFRFSSEPYSEVKIELNATEVKEGEAGLKIHIFNAGGKKSDSNAQKMTVYAKKITEADKAEEKARIAKAEAEQNFIKKAGLSSDMIKKLK